MAQKWFDLANGSPRQSVLDAAVRADSTLRVLMILPKSSCLAELREFSFDPIERGITGTRGD
jgi:hypothetical protein